MDIIRKDGNGRMSKAVIYNGLLFLSGQVPSGGKDIFSQTQSVLDKIDELLKANDCSKEKILSATIYLKDIAMWADMNTIWDKWVAPGCEPVRTTVEASLANSDLLIEITIIAAK